VANSGVIVVSGTSQDLRVPPLSFVNPVGDLVSKVVLSPPIAIETQGVTLRSTVNVDELAVDQDGNVLVRSFVTDVDDAFNSFPSIVQRVLANGEIDTSFGLGGTAVLPSAGDIIFDLESRLVVVGDSLLRFEISLHVYGSEQFPYCDRLALLMGLKPSPRF